MWGVALLGLIYFLRAIKYLNRQEWVVHQTETFVYDEVVMSRHITKPTASKSLDVAKLAVWLLVGKL